MGFKPASEIELPADRRVAQKKTLTVSRNSREIAEAISIVIKPQAGISSPVSQF